MATDKYYVLEGTLRNETERAFLMDVDMVTPDNVSLTIKDLWIPKRNVHQESRELVESDDTHFEDEIEVYVVRWWLRKEGYI